jgi:hypothetical protein
MSGNPVVRAAEAAATEATEASAAASAAGIASLRVHADKASAVNSVVMGRW